jgi:hypothetical protein
MVARLRDANQYGTRAAQPAATAVDQGTTYAVSDEGGIIERSDGTDWQAIGGTAFDTAGINLLLVLPEAADYIDVVVPFDCDINEATLLADVAGDLVLDLWVDTYANYPPTVADTITASAKPTLSTATKSQDTTLTGWTLSLSKGDVLRASVDSIATLEQTTLYLGLTRT